MQELEIWRWVLQSKHNQTAASLATIVLSICIVVFVGFLTLAGPELVLAVVLLLLRDVAFAFASNVFFACVFRCMMHVENIAGQTERC